MATIFAGTAPDRNAQRRRDILQAGALAVRSFATAGDLFARAEELVRQRQRDELAKVAIAADLSGGYSKLPQSAKDKIPGLLGVELPRDNAGRVVLNDQFDEFFKNVLLERAKQDPAMAEKIALIAGGLQQKATDPAALEVEIGKAVMAAQGRAEVEAGKDRRAAASNAVRMATSKAANAARLRAAEISASARLSGGAGSIRSIFDLNPETNELVVAGTMKGAIPLSDRDAKTIIANQREQSLAESRAASAELTRSRNELVRESLKSMPLSVLKQVTSILATSQKDKKNKDLIGAQAAKLALPYLKEAGVDATDFLSWWGSSAYTKTLAELQQLELVHPEAPGQNGFGGTAPSVTPTFGTPTTSGGGTISTPTTSNSSLEGSAFPEQSPSGIRYRRVQ